MLQDTLIQLFVRDLSKLKTELEAEILFVEVQFDFENKVYTNLPYDMHPNEAGHKYIFEKVKPVFKILTKSD